MSAVATTRRTGFGTRRPTGRGTNRRKVEPTTLGDSPSLAPFRFLLQRFVRANSVDIHRLRKELVALIRRSRYAGLCVNELIDECIHHGGPDGLVKAVEVLAHLDHSLVRDESLRFFLAELPRWRKGQQNEYTRYTVRDDVWYVLLRAVCQTAEYSFAYSFLKSVFVKGPDSLREGGAAAASDLGDRFPKHREELSALLSRVLDGQTPLRFSHLSRTSRNAIADALHELKGA